MPDYPGFRVHDHDATPLAYAKLDKQLVGRCAERRKLSHNTYAIRRADHIAVRLHNTDILRFYPDGRCVADVGEWMTSTTKDRLNQFLPYGWHIYQERGVWYVHPSGAWDKSQCWVYANGITFNPDGTVDGAETPDSVKKQAKLVKRLRKYARAYIEALFKGKVGAPGLGDCLYCGFRTVDESVPVGESFGDVSHLESHLDEPYYVPSLLMRAIEVFPVSQYARGTLGELWSGEATPETNLMNRLGGARTRDIAVEQLEKSLYRYLKRQFGVAS